MKVHLFNTIVGEADGYLKHGIGMISSSLKQAGHEVEIVNKPLDFVDFHKVEVAGISGLTSCTSMMKHLAARIKQNNKNAIIFAGGVGPTLHHVDFVDENIDFIFLGEGEITFPKIITEFSESKKLPTEKIIKSEPVVDVNILPFVDRTNYTQGERPHDLLRTFPAPMYSIFNSRWCRKKCKFCAPASKTLYGGIKKLRTVENFMQELMTLPTDFMTLMIHDDNMLENKEWCEELVEAFKKRDLYIPFINQAYAPEIVRGEELLSKLRDIGLVGVLVGFESGSDRMLKYMRKGSTRQWNIKAAETLHRLDLRIGANLMFGCPTETYDEMMETVSMYNNHIYRDGYTIPSPAVYTPYPGSEWYDELSESGLLTITSDSQYERYMHTQNKIKGIDYNLVRKAMSQLIPFQGLK